jgi:hypothetical protein
MQVWPIMLKPSSHPGLGHADDPGGVLIGARLHDQVIVEGLQRVELIGIAEADGRIVAQQDHLHPLQPHDAIGLGPAPVVADAHAQDAAEAAPDRKAQIAHLEEALLQMLAGRSSTSAWPGRWTLRYLPMMRPVLSTRIELLKRRLRLPSITSSA